jgi:hypothetical protein
MAVENKRQDSQREHQIAKVKAFCEAILAKKSALDNCGETQHPRGISVFRD